MELTRRQQIETILKEQGMSAQHLANYFRVEMSEIIDDINHVVLSTRNECTLKIEPAYCKNCGFVFRERSKIKAPSRCPRCKKEWIQEPIFILTDKNN